MELLKLHRELGEVRSTQHAEAQQLRRDLEAGMARLQVRRRFLNMSPCRTMPVDMSYN